MVKSPYTKAQLASASPQALAREKANQAFWDSGQRFRDPNHKVHYANLNIPYGPGDVQYNKGGQIHEDYFKRVSPILKITPEEARKASGAGSGKSRDRMVRMFQDPSGGLESQYAQNRKLAKKVTASFNQKAKLKKVAQTNNQVIRSTSSNEDIVKANAKQTAYVASLRAGGIGIAEALLNPQTSQTYLKNDKPVSKSETSINAETFFSERGYDLTKPELIPDSIFKPEKQKNARLATSGDLNKMANTYEKTSQKVLDARNKIKKESGSTIIPNTIIPPIKASAPLEFLGPTNKNKIENFELLDTRPLSLNSLANIQYGLNTKTGKTERLKTVGETTTPEMQFFGQFVQGSRNTFDSYGNLITNLGNSVTGKEQQPMSRPPVQDQFFGAVIESGQNTFFGKSTDRADDPMGDFLNVQKKRADTVGLGQVSGELFTEALFWALPIGAISKVAKGGLAFFKPGVQTVKQSNNFTTNKDFFKAEGKTKDVSWADQLGAFFGPKGPKTEKIGVNTFGSSSVSLGTGKTKISVDSFFSATPKKSSGSFFASSVSLGTGKTKPKPNNDFFGGSSSPGKTTSNFFDKPKPTKTNNGLVLLTKQKPKQTPKPFKSYPIQLGPTLPKVIPKVKTKVIPKVKAKVKAKVKPKPQQFFTPLVTPKVKTKQKLKQTPKQIPKQKPTTRQTPIFKQPTKQKQKQTGIIAPWFPSPGKSSFLFPIPRPTRGGLGGQRRRGTRYGKRTFTAWNVNPNQVGGFLKGPTYKKSRSDYIFKDLDKRTKKEKKKKDYDYLDFF